MRYFSILIALFICFSCTENQKTSNTSPLPWEREISLKEGAKTVSFEQALVPDNANPRRSFKPGEPLDLAMPINNLKMSTSIWGPPNRVTISLTKNNVWDRRIHPKDFEFPTLQEVIDGAFSPANADWRPVPKWGNRPYKYSYLLKEGGMAEGYWDRPVRYAFPGLKPVGQIIMGMEEMEGTDQPTVKQSCANGLVSLQLTKGEAKAQLEYILGMENDVYAIRGTFDNMTTPIWLRLYRHRDTGHLHYMSEDGTTYTSEYAKQDSAFNQAVDPPTSGRDGRYFWIKQQFPGEKTFPDGFEYVLMGIIKNPKDINIETVENEKNLGTPPWDELIPKMPGAAATVSFKPGNGSKMEALITVVTTMDGDNLLALAKEKLAKAEKAGFDGIVAQNTEWWNAFYDTREVGRVFYGNTGTDCTEDIVKVYKSYADHHGGGTKTDMRQYECSAHYVLPEMDMHRWLSSPAYNEIFTSKEFVRNRADHQDMWKQIVEHWAEAGRKNAKEMYNMPGIAIFNGFFPPIKPDQIVHPTVTFEFSLETMAQTFKPIWDEWDYGGDIEFLKNECYPLMREMALFYAAYAKKGDDGYFHIIPSMETERWGWYTKLERNKDVIGSLSMFRWALNRTADAAELLDVDAELRDQWREVANKLVPYATWDTPEGPVFTAIEGIEPIRLDRDHPWESTSLPTTLADEINLDSPQELKDMMIRTAHKLKPGTRTSRHTFLLLGKADSVWQGDAEALLNSRSGRIHLFPAIQPTEELAFREFQARGGFLVSAQKKAEGVTFLEVKSRRNIDCHLMNPWPGRKIKVYDRTTKNTIPVEVDASNGECLVFSTEAGHKYEIWEIIN